jgi:protein involved in polysaccharide export with SLBB domain
MTSALSKQLAVIFWISSTATTVLHGQLEEKKDDPFSQKNQSQNQIQYQQSLQNLKMAVMDGPVDPREYIVGPGDIYSVNIWISPPLNLQLPVTPEGSIIIPTVGEVSVAGLHLDAAKEKIAAEIRKKYISGNISFTLLTPRVFEVRVTGFGFLEATVYVQATGRAQDAIALAKNQTDELLNTMNMTGEGTKSTKLSREEAQKLSVQGSLRHIEIRHRDGTESKADIERFIATRERTCNPLLRDGDVVIVPARNILRDFVGVYGAVNGEGAYEFVDGDSLMSMIQIARGCSPLADSSHVAITRTDAAGDTMQTISADLTAIAAGASPNVSLQRGDRIVVREKTELRRDYKVHMEGEVLYPGYYPITRDSSRLSEIIKRAGGLKETASLEASHILRDSKPSEKVKIDQLENARGRTSQEDSAYYHVESEIRMNGELVVADFVSLFANNDKTKDVILRDGDRIIIAQKVHTVYVFGQVVQPGHVQFSSNQSYKYFIDKAGGFADDAVKGDVHIIKANSKQWLSPGETTIEEGDYIWVPKEPYRPFSYYIQIYGQLFGIVGTLVTVAVLVVQLKK